MIAWLLDKLWSRSEARQVAKYRVPPPGWSDFGTHIDDPVELEFSAEIGEDLLPRWERPAENLGWIHLCGEKKKEVWWPLGQRCLFCWKELG